MKLLILSTDQKIFEEKSSVRQRMIDYGGLFEELHIIIYTKRGFRMQNLGSSNHVFIYPTNTRFKLFYFFDVYRIAKKIILNSKSEILNPWIITTQDPFETALVGYWLKKEFKIPLQIQSHSDFLSPYFKRESWKNKIRVFLGSWLIKKADGVRVVSERIRQSLVKNFQLPSSKITVLPIIFDTDDFQKQPVSIDLHKKYPNFESIILVASRLTREKNVGLAIQAMTEIIKHNPKSLLLIVGEGPEHRNLKFKIENLKLKDNIILEPWTDDLVSYYRTSNVFVLTSNYEGGARSPVEAAAAGLPVIMTDVAPAREIIKDGINGFVVPVGDALTLAEKVIWLINHPKQRGEFSRNTLAISKQFPSKSEYLQRYKNSLINLL